MSTKLNLRIHSVRCIDETGGSFREKFGDDEISLGGFSIDNKNKVDKIKESSIYSGFDDGDVKQYNPPKVFASFRLPTAFSSAQKFAVGFILAEKDSGGFGSILNKIYEFVLEEIKKRLESITKAREVSLAASNGSVQAKTLVLPIGFIWGMIQPIVVSYITGKIKTWVGDDIFPLKDVTTTISSVNHTWHGKKTSPVEMVEFRAHDGVYQIYYDWQLV